jgi:hypothetical protein
MAFITKQGYRFSENGWRMCDTAELDFGAVPVIGWKVGVRKGAPNLLLKALMVRLHREVEPMDTRQCGVYTATNSMGNSNHNSGTALDYNWNKHPFHAWGTWGANRAKVDKIVTDFRGTIEFGGNWTAPRDEMHFELHYGEGHQGTEQLASELRNGLWGIFAPGSQPTPGPQLPSGDDYLDLGDSGQKVLDLQRGLNRVFPKYRTTPVAEDGDFGPLTQAAVKEFQERAGLDVDGIVGPATRAALKKYGLDLDNPPKGPAVKTDRQLLEQIATDTSEIRAQLGEGHPDWKSKGMTLRDKLWSLSDQS